MPATDNQSQSPAAFEETRTLVAVIDMSLSSWVVLGLVPGLQRRPEKKLRADEAGLLSLLHRWRDEAERGGCRIERICVAFEAARDGFWLARWLEGHEIEPHVIHASSIPVKREQRRAKTDRLDCRLLMRAYVGWLRGEAEHCRMVAVPSIESEDAKIPHRERAARSRECTRVINRMKSTLARLGIRGFKPNLKKAAGKLDDLCLPILGDCAWIHNGAPILITGPCGTGKSWISCDLARIDLLVLDDWGLAPIEPARGRDLLEILDDRFGRRPVIVTSQLPVADWHRQLKDPSLADAILDRLVHGATRFELHGASMRIDDVGAETEP